MKNVLAEILMLERKIASEDAEGNLICDGEKGCKEPVTYIDDKGWIYCTNHGLRFKGHGRRCRKLTNKELELLKSGKPIGKY